MLGMYFAFASSQVFYICLSLLVTFVLSFVIVSSISKVMLSRDEYIGRNVHHAEVNLSKIKDVEVKIENILQEAKEQQNQVIMKIRKQLEEQSSALDAQFVRKSKEAHSRFLDSLELEITNISSDATNIIKQVTLAALNKFNHPIQEDMDKIDGGISQKMPHLMQKIKSFINQ